MSTTRPLADVAVAAPIPRPLTYLVPAALAARVRRGARVVCTLGNRRVVGVVSRLHEGEPPPKAKPLVDVLEGVSVPEELLAFLERLGSYYLVPLGEVVRLALPPLDREASDATVVRGLFDTKKGVSARKVKVVVPTDGQGPPPPRSEGLLAFVRAHGELPLARLEERFGGARGTTARLEAAGLVRFEEREAARDPYFAEALVRDVPPALTTAQTEAVTAISEALERGEPATMLLHGVTGSGKTEVYLHAIAKAKELGKTSVVLVPEIALTPQLVSRFRARFGDEVAVLHSGLTPRERFDMWQRLRRGEVDVAIGARSALFAPLERPGLVVVDEEHDGSFKQEEGVRYHARDMAILRSHLARGVCVLGSATPSLETEHLVRTGKARRLVLPDRARAQAMPTVEIVDLRRMGPGPTGDKRISLVLHRALEKTLAAKGQAILFLNRRGFAPSVRCEACGKPAECPNCAVALTFHRRAGGVVRCHYCDHTTALPERCVPCGSNRIALEGLGTEKLEDTLAQAFPEARVARLDRDVASGKEAGKILDRVRAREIDILVGTQMVTKGHDLPHVTLVGVVNADAALSIPDFRASERAFQIFVQVAGRAGRGDQPGRVLVQTYDPDAVAIQHAMKHDVAGFVERELADRRELGYPPYTRLALVRVEGADDDETRAAAGRLADAARGLEGVDVRGPAPAPIPRLRGRFRHRVMVKSAARDKLRAALLAVHRAAADVPRTVRVVVDVDPVQLL